MNPTHIAGERTTRPICFSRSRSFDNSIVSAYSRESSGPFLSCINSQTACHAQPTCSSALIWSGYARVTYTIHRSQCAARIILDTISHHAASASALRYLAEGVLRAPRDHERGCPSSFACEKSRIVWKAKIATILNVPYLKM